MIQSIAKYTAYNLMKKVVFSESRPEETRALYALGTYEPVHISDADGQRLYHSVFVDKVKDGGRKRSRFRVAASNDREHELMTFAPTIQRMSLRMLLAVGAIYDIRTRDITKAFVQSDTGLRRSIYMHPPKELNLKKDMVLTILKPLYGLPESSLHWFNCYSKHHKEKLNLSDLLRPTRTRATVRRRAFRKK